jgi:tetratricopeptide (TPR) repeat protein
MIMRALAALLALTLVTTFALPVLSAESTKDRRDRLTREALKMPSQAEAALKEKDYDKAIDLYTKALESGAFDTANEGKILFNRGRAQHAKGDCNAAIADYNKSLEIAKVGDVYFSRAICELDLKQPDLALASLDEAIRIDAESAVYRNARCKVLFNKKEFAKALPDCEKALLTQTTDKDLMVATAQSAEQTGNKKRAAEVYAQLLAADPANTIAADGLKRTAK